ncbi:Crp/Fnr family transcriptional regulator [Wenxinia marina]|uniref:cAMP-binding protein n=1 Tax=Wenxinia marina DSM 24838 TaxID=1123501 RepID=A0A0D0Q6H8_9RHOB|nr:Crp/Fnr family transcriptional regulator [Wenxinia marina]KIQ70064.1 cAMP-binding protein [Wenxinia marina DSM 24838]GGL63222.1 Crp/Fnr family transcriptional regulator [Wenxinia marina]
MDDTNYTGMVRRLSPDLWRRLSEAHSGSIDLSPREVMTRAGQRLHRSALLLDGIIAREVTDRGGNRQIVSIQVPGDFVDLHGLPLKQLDHDVVAMGPARVALFEHDDLERLMGDDAEYARALWSLTMIDASISRHWTFRMGQLRALAGMANFLCEMQIRLQLCGRADGSTPFALPWTQGELGQICGMSVVHVNRVLRDLREAGIATVRNGEATMHDRARAERIGLFDAGYLYLPWNPDES